VRRLINADDLENFLQPLIGRDQLVFKNNVELVHAANFGDHDDPAQAEEQLVVGGDRIGVEFVDAAAESEANEPVDMTAGFIDRERHAAQILKIFLEHEIVLALVAAVLFDRVDEPALA